MNILVATEKPFAKKAVDGIRIIAEEACMKVSLLEKYTSTEELYAAVATADALIVRSDKISAQVIDAAPNLKIVVRAGAGYDNLDLEACTRKGIVAMNTPGQNANAVAELAIGLMIYMARNQFQPGTGSELKGKKLGLQAYGNVGRLVSGLAKGFGMEVMAFDPFVSASSMEAEGIRAAGSVEELYRSCDYVSVHIPATPETKGSIGKNLLSLMPKGACLINTARKEVINEQELEEILLARTDLKYAADVAPSNIDALTAQFHTRVYATPKKMGAETAEANINAGLAAARQIVGFFKQGDRKFQLNK